MEVFSDDGKFFNGSLTEVQKHLREVAPDVRIKRTSGRTKFDADNNIIYLKKGKVRIRDLADEMQHAIDYANGFKKPQMPKLLRHMVMEEGFAVKTDAGLKLANEWWHRRIFTRAIQNIDQGTPGFKSLFEGIEDVYAAYLKAKGTLSLDQLKSLDLRGLY